MKVKTVFVCQECGALHPKWSGKCGGCGAWNTLVEETRASTKTGKAIAAAGVIAMNSLIPHEPHAPRRLSGISEFDRVCGNGMVEGSVLLIGGDPGIGKSTLLLQVTAALSQDATCYYISGEESVTQIQQRAARMGLAHAPLQLASSHVLPDIISTMEASNKPDVVVIDSIQTMFNPALESAPGTVGQVRACAHELIQCAKKHNIILVLVGHVTKEGTLAGPRVLEHMVDTVLYFEGDRHHSYRLLRTVKNRFGATDEIGVFGMSDKGLEGIANPSSLFMNHQDEPRQGVAVFAGMEGSRPLLMEIQALIVPAPYGNPRRTVVGWDPNRLAMVLAVLETRAGVKLGQFDIYLNVAGGLRIQEPAVDMAVAAALISERYGLFLPQASLFCGEVGLSGDIRPVSYIPQRLKEASKLGFAKAFVPSYEGDAPLLAVERIPTIRDLYNILLKKCAASPKRDRQPEPTRVYTTEKEELPYG